MRLLPPLEAHRIWAANYDAMPNPLLALETRILVPMLPDVRGKRIVDVAAGTGRWARRLGALGANVICADACFEMVRQAPLPVLVADSGALPLPDDFADLVICAFATDYMAPCLEELGRITRSGGHVFVSDMHPEAAQRGWTRSFRSSTGVVTIQSRRACLAELTSPRLSLVNLVEATLGEPERPLFVRAGKEASFEAACRVPAIYVAQWCRS